MSMFLDLDRDAASHLATALYQHVKYCRRMGLRVPADIVALQESAQKQATGGQGRPCFDGSDQGWDPVRVEPRVVTYADAAEALAVSVRTVRRLVAEGKLNATRIGGSSRILVADIDIYLSDAA